MAEKMENRYRRLIKNTLLLLAGNFVTKVLSFLMVPFYTSILTTSDYGTADLISNIVLLVLPFFSLLMDEAIMRFTLDKDNDRKQVFTIAFTLSTAGFLIAMCFSPLLLLSSNLRTYYWFIVLYYVVSWIYNVVSNYVKGLDKVALTTMAGIIHTFVYLGLNIVFLLFLKTGVYGYLLAINLSNMIATMFLIIACKLYKNFISLRKIDWRYAKEMLAYSIPLIPNYISWWFNNASDKIVLTFFCGAAANGVYSVAYKIPSMLSSVTTIFSSAWKISSVDNFGSKESINFYNQIYKLYSGFLMIGASGLIFATKPLAGIMFSKDFFVAWRITPILVVAYMFSAMAQYIGSIFTASKKTKKLFHSSLSGAICNLVLNILLIPCYGAFGAAIATVIGYIVIWLIDMINTRQLLQMNFNLNRIVPASMLLFFEVLAILYDSWKGYFITSICFLGIIVINRKEVVLLSNILLNKVQAKIYKN